MCSILSAVTKYKPEEGIWQGPNWPYEYGRHVSIGQVLLKSLLLSPSHVGQICHDDGSVATNAELSQRAVRVALHLRDLGMKEGNVIGLAAKNSKNLAPLMIGAFLQGLPVNPLDPTFLKADIVHMFRITEPKIIVCDRENWPEIRKAHAELKSTAQVFVFGAVEPDEEYQSVDDLLTPHKDEENYSPFPISDSAALPAVIICSSGTTGPPKGVALSHAAITYQLIHNISRLDSGDRFLCFSSLYWLSGLMTLVMTTAQQMTRVITEQRFSAELLLEIVRKHQVTSLLTPPTQLALVLQCASLRSEHLDSVHTWLCGGGHVPEENRQRINRHLRNGTLLIGYGCSEIGGICSLTSDNRRGVGDLTKGVSVKIVSEDGHCNLGPGEHGEVCIKTELPMLGYYKNSVATSNSIQGGWFHTGDIGYVDDTGCLYIVDRSKDIMKVDNFHVNPSEIEGVIGQLPEVVLVSVFGVPHPVHSDAPAAMVVKRDQCQLDDQVVVRHVEQSLPQYKWLKGGVYFVEKMPTTASGKILKRMCKDMVVSGMVSNKGGR